MVKSLVSERVAAFSLRESITLFIFHPHIPQLLLLFALTISFSAATAAPQYVIGSYGWTPVHYDYYAPLTSWNGHYYAPLVYAWNK